MNREDYRLLPLAAVGVSKGLWECYIRPHNQEELIDNIALGVALGAVAVTAYLVFNEIK